MPLYFMIQSSWQRQNMNHAEHKLSIILITQEKPCEQICRLRDTHRLLPMTPERTNGIRWATRKGLWMKAVATFISANTSMRGQPQPDATLASNHMRSPFRIVVSKTQKWPRFTTWNKSSKNNKIVARILNRLKLKCPKVDTRRTKTTNNHWRNF